MPRIGSRKLYHILYKDLRLLKVGRDRLFSIIKANHMDIIPKRAYHITTNSYHRFYKHKNIVRDIVPTRPEQFWVSDITYIGNRSNPIYLALVTDAYSKKVVGYDISDSLHADGTVRALKMAVRNRQYKNKELIHHSDRGIQYCGNTYQKTLTKYRIRCSMTESYDPYENAIAERINGILKYEFILNRQNLELSTMKSLVENSIYVYNNYRPHSSCSMKTPSEMHKQNEIRIKTYRKQNSSKTKFAAIV